MSQSHDLDRKGDGSLSKGMGEGSFYMGVESVERQDNYEMNPLPLQGRVDDRRS